MIDEESVKKAEDIMRKYERNWGKCSGGLS